MSEPIDQVQSANRFDIQHCPSDFHTNTLDMIGTDNFLIVSIANSLWCSWNLCSIMIQLGICWMPRKQLMLMGKLPFADVPLIFVAYHFSHHLSGWIRQSICLCTLNWWLQYDCPLISLRYFSLFSEICFECCCLLMQGTFGAAWGVSDIWRIFRY